MKKTLIIGATPNEDRYAYKAAGKLTEAGHQIIPFGIKKGEVFGETIINEWEDFKDIDTVTIYVGAVRQDAYYDKIILLNPNRVLFNPGTENPDFQTKLIKVGIEVEEACTLVLLSLKNY
tara:strand:- start:3191 stop:3550 length:360 start_codon:yes stop_codon:yes gene_type:complete